MSDNTCIHLYYIMKKLPFQVYLDRGEADLLERLAKQLGLSKAETVREALRRLALELSGSGDPLLDLIGGLDNPAVPVDLSTRHDEYAVQARPARRVAESKRRRGSST